MPQYKYDYCNQNWPEATRLMFAPPFKGFCLNVCWSFTNAINRFSENVLDRANMLPRIKKAWRSRVRQKSSTRRREKESPVLTQNL
jgi:hypothetical protein